MSTLSLTDALRATSLAADLSDALVNQLASLARQKSCSAGTILFREGASHDGFYLVVKGHVALEMCMAGRGCTELLTLGPGEVLAWSSLLGNQCMTATAIVQDDVVLLEFSGTALASACEANHELGYHVMRRLATALSMRLLATRLQLLDLYVDDSPGNPAYGGSPTGNDKELVRRSGELP